MNSRTCMHIRNSRNFPSRLSRDQFRYVNHENIRRSSSPNDFILDLLRTDTWAGFSFVSRSLCGSDGAHPPRIRRTQLLASPDKQQLSPQSSFSRTRLVRLLHYSLLRIRVAYSDAFIHLTWQSFLSLSLLFFSREKRKNRKGGRQRKSKQGWRDVKRGKMKDVSWILWISMCVGSGPSLHIILSDTLRLSKHTLLILGIERRVFDLNAGPYFRQYFSSFAFFPSTRRKLRVIAALV